MKFWTDKDGKKLTFTEFKGRWKQGVMSVSVLQQARSQATGYWFIIAGIIWGVVYSIQNSFWWLMLIMIGALLINLIAWFANHQKIKLLSGIEETLKKANEAPGTGIGYIQ